MPDGLPLMASTTTPARDGEIIRPTHLHALGMVRGELARTHALLGELDPADWLRLAECTGWSVRDVVAHMIGGNEELSRPVRLIRRVRVGGAVERAGPQVGEGPVAVVITVGDGEAVPLPVPDRDTVPPALLPSLA